MRIYVGNLSYDTNDDGLRAEFEKFGAVRDCKIMTDRETGRSRGFAFIEMDDDAGRAAIDGLDGVMLDSRNLRVNEARPRGPRF